MNRVCETDLPDDISADLRDRVREWRGFDVSHAAPKTAPGRSRPLLFGGNYTRTTPSSRKRDHIQVMIAAVNCLIAL